MIELKIVGERAVRRQEHGQPCLGCRESLKEGQRVHALSTGALCCSETCVELARESEADLEWGAEKAAADAIGLMFDEREYNAPSGA